MTTKPDSVYRGIFSIYFCLRVAATSTMVLRINNHPNYFTDHHWTLAPKCTSKVLSTKRIATRENALGGDDAGIVAILAEHTDHIWWPAKETYTGLGKKETQTRMNRVPLWKCRYPSHTEMYCNQPLLMLVGHRWTTWLGIIGLLFLWNSEFFFFIKAPNSDQSESYLLGRQTWNVPAMRNKVIFKNAAISICPHVNIEDIYLYLATRTSISRNLVEIIPCYECSRKPAKFAQRFSGLNRCSMQKVCCWIHDKIEHIEVYL